MIELFRKLGKSKWTPWIGTAPFIVAVLSVMLEGRSSRVLGILAFFISIFAGIALGVAAAHFLDTHVLRMSDSSAKRLSSAFSCFGFLFLPALVGSWTNVFLDTGIEMHSLSAHFIWACIAGTIAFWAAPAKPKNGD